VVAIGVGWAYANRVLAPWALDLVDKELRQGLGLERTVVSLDLVRRTRDRVVDGRRSVGTSGMVLMGREKGLDSMMALE
jgi:hypothetical protein